MVHIKNDMFNNNKYVINNEFEIWQFDYFMNCVFDCNNIDGIIQNTYFDFIHTINDMHNRYLRESGKTQFADFSKFQSYGLSCNYNILNDVIWNCHFTPITFKILNYIRQNKMDNNNCLIIAYNFSGDENYILFDCISEKYIDMGCMDNFEHIKISSFTTLLDTFIDTITEME